MKKAVFICLVVTAFAAALALRVASPLARPMHHDEANQAVRFGDLLETGNYQYDRSDHHGPTLYYLTLPFAWLRGQHTLASLDEQTVRLVPAVFGLGTILLFLLLAGGLGRGAIAAASVLAAISPVLTYYSRDYIQETLFVFFSLAFLIASGRLALRPAVSSALCAGVFAGLAYATKETCVIVFVAAAAGLVVARRGIVRQEAEQARPQHRWYPVAALGLAVAVSFVLYSSFLRNLRGPLESLRAYSIYFERGVAPGGHAEPWYYYLRILGWSASGGLVWTEGLILLLAVVGIVFSFRARGPRTSSLDVARDDPELVEGSKGASSAFWRRYFAVYSLVAAILFSLIPYKTPWNVLPFYIGFVLMAGIGASALAGVRSGVLRAAVYFVLVVGVIQLAGQSWRASFRYAADPRNPYAYLHTSPDFLNLVRRVNDVAVVHGDPANMLVKVVAGPYEQWPLPWYLRGMKRVGYWTNAAGAGPLDAASVVVASQEFAPALDAALGDRYVSEFYGLRPDVLMSVYIERSLWQRFLQSRSGAARP